MFALRVALRQRLHTTQMQMINSTTMVTPIATRIVLLESASSSSVEVPRSGSITVGLSVLDVVGGSEKDAVGSECAVAGAVDGGAVVGLAVGPEPHIGQQIHSI